MFGAGKRPTQGLSGLGHRAQWQGGGNPVQRLEGDSDLDHAAPRLIGTTLSAISAQSPRLLKRQVDLFWRQRPTTAAFQRRDDLALLGVQALIWLRRHGRA